MINSKDVSVLPRPFWVTALFFLLAVGLLWKPTQLARKGWCDFTVFQGLKTISPALFRSEPVLLSVPTSSPVLVPTPQTQDPRPVVLRLFAPAAQKVTLRGDTVADETPLVRDSEGLWQVSLSLSPGRYAYVFYVDGEKVLDPTNPEKTGDRSPSSVLVVR